MPKVIINDHEYEGEIGERIVDIARRNGAHMGFVCDGSGFCQTCACRVLEGKEHLSEPTDAEKNWFNDMWLEEGHRLGCQASIRGAGPVRVLSRAEELRRQTVAVFVPPEETTSTENAKELGSHVTRLVKNQVFRFPGNAAGAVSMISKVRLSTDSFQRVLSDGTKVVQTMTGVQLKDMPKAISIPVVVEDDQEGEKPAQGGQS
jgi:chlorosome envelope protein I